LITYIRCVTIHTLSEEVAVPLSTDRTDDPSGIGELVQAVGRMVQALRTMKSTGENDHGAHVIISVLYRSGPMRPSDLAGTCILDVSTVSRHARQMESEGLLAKIADPEDRRAHRLALTEAGIDKVEAIWAERMTVLEQKLAGWSKTDVADMVRLSRRFCADVGLTEPVSVPGPEEVRAIHLAALNTLHTQEKKAHSNE
jgi:DNA-binding MarR family transcriptional regulator